MSNSLQKAEDDFAIKEMFIKIRKRYAEECSGEKAKTLLAFALITGLSITDARTLLTTKEKDLWSPN